MYALVLVLMSNDGVSQLALEMASQATCEEQKRILVHEPGATHTAAFSSVDYKNGHFTVHKEAYCVAKR